MKNKLSTTTYIKKIVSVVLITFGSLLYFHHVQAATLLMQPSSSRIEENNLFTVKIFVNTQDKFVNNIESTLNFPNDLVEVVSVDSKVSIFTLWVEQANFSNASGVVSFNGGITNPGYKGSGGQLLSIVFKAKKGGVASLFFSGPAIRENDGLGTDILTGQNSASITIFDKAATQKPETIDDTKKIPDDTNAQTPKEVEKKPTSENNLLGIAINSPTHPDQNIWYSLKNASIVWRNPSNIENLQTTLSRQSNSVPTKTLPIDTNQRDIKDIDDGVSYFNIRYKKDGVWSEISSYKLQIDTEAPYDLSLIAKPQEDGKTALYYKAEDDISGISDFEITIDSGVPIKLAVARENIYLASLPIGKHTLELTATDKAGNKSSYKTTTNLVASAPPKITFYSESVDFGDSIFVRGLSIYPNANIAITLKSVSGGVNDFDVQSDKNGKFSFSSEKIHTAGTYELWATLLSSDGAKGPVSERVKITVSPDISFVKKVREFATSGMGIMSMVLLLVGASSAYGWYKYFGLRQHMIKNDHFAEYKSYKKSRRKRIK